MRQLKTGMISGKPARFNFNRLPVVLIILVALSIVVFYSSGAKLNADITGFVLEDQKSDCFTRAALPDSCSNKTTIAIILYWGYSLAFDLKYDLTAVRQTALI